MRRPQASKSTRFFGSTVSVLALGTVLAGCAAPGEVSVPAESAQQATTLERIDFNPDVPLGRDLAIINKDRSLRLGATSDEALSVFPAPARSYPFSTLPAQFGKGFKATGWDSDLRSFGCILYGEGSDRDVVVLAMETQDSVSEDDVASAIALYKKQYGEPQLNLPGKDVQYMIWERPERRLMLNVSTNSKGSRALTVAVGVPQVMGELGITQDQARTDWASAKETLSGKPAG
ncbi:MAG TPA: hypothetical protein VNI20_10515 [Fimbriimonadaceae bacterium]|nr:hypothetical protein [Fimbriimonadaceae bacterium]